MEKFAVVWAFICALSATAYAQVGGEETPAIPQYRISPAYPVACQQMLGPDSPSQAVSVMFDVTDDGNTENARVRETSDECFNDAAIAAVRSWKYEPRRLGKRQVSQEDLEVTFTFILEEETQTQDFDARPLVRVPPHYPENCMRTAKSKESVTVEFDVTAEGKTANLSAVETTNRCLNQSSITAVEQWRYSPKIQDGEPVAREKVQTVMTYRLENSVSLPFRPAVMRKLESAQRLATGKKDPEAALTKLGDIENKYGDNFSPIEQSAFHQVRGVARIEAKDYAGALDDLRVVRQMSLGSQDGGKALQATIEKLEAALGVPPSPVQYVEQADDVEEEVSDTAETK